MRWIEDPSCLIDGIVRILRCKGKHDMTRFEELRSAFVLKVVSYVEPWLPSRKSQFLDDTAGIAIGIHALRLLRPNNLERTPINAICNRNIF